MYSKHKPRSITIEIDLTHSQIQTGAARVIYVSFPACRGERII